MDKYEKFDLQKALDGAELVTRDGKEVTEWYYFKNSKRTQPIYAVVNGEIYSYKIEGNYYVTGDISANDLFIKPKVNKCWVNVYCNSCGGITISAPYSNKEDAINGKHPVNYIKTIRITDEVEE